MQVISIDNCSLKTTEMSFKQASKLSGKGNTSSRLRYEQQARRHGMRYYRTAMSLAEEPQNFSIKDCSNMSKKYLKMAYENIAACGCKVRAFVARSNCFFRK